MTEPTEYLLGSSQTDRARLLAQTQPRAPIACTKTPRFSLDEL
jgi:hypothetical protein